MIYTRNKDTAKTKLIKTQNRLTNNNIIEELKQRLENRKNHQNQNHYLNQYTHSQQQQKQQKPQKQNNTNSKYKQVMQLNKISQIKSNPFNKIKKNAFLELVSPTNQLKKETRKYRDGQNNVKAEKDDEKYKQKINEKVNNRIVYESPIQELYKKQRQSIQSNISSNYSQSLRSQAAQTQPRNTLKITNSNLSLSILPIPQPSLSNITKTCNSSQQQYLTLLQNKLTQLKSQLSTLPSLRGQMIASNTKLNQLSRENEKLSQKLQVITKQKQQLYEQWTKLNVRLKKYERFFNSMKSVLLKSAMELIEIRSQICSKQCEISGDDDNGLYCEQRVISINECLSKVEQVTYISDRIIQLGSQLKRQQNYHNRHHHHKNQHQHSHQHQHQQIDNLRMNNEQLTITSIYQQKIIQKLKQQIRQKQSSNQYHKLKERKIKSYSFIDEIKLLRHEINRLTNENCVLIEKINRLEKNQLFKQQSIGDRGVQKVIREYEQSKYNKIKKESYNKEENKDKYWVENNVKSGKIRVKQQQQVEEIRKIKQINEQELSILIKQFKGSLTLTSGLKKSNQKNQKNDQNTQQLTVRSITTPQINSSQTQQLKNQLKSLQQSLEQKSQQIYKLQVEKQFLISQLDRLQVENEGIRKEQQKNRGIAEKIQFQNNQLIDKVIELERKKQEKLMDRQIDQKNDKLMIVQNQKLKVQVQSLRAELRTLKQHISSSKSNTNLNQKLTQTKKAQPFCITPQLQGLLSFLKQSTSNQPYHLILLDMIQSYENKISILREENVLMRVQNQELMEYVNDNMYLLKSLEKYFNSRLGYNSQRQREKERSKRQEMMGGMVRSVQTTGQDNNHQCYENNHDKGMLSSVISSASSTFSTCKILTIQISKKITEYEQIRQSHNLQPQVYLKRKSPNRISYYLMMIRSLSKGIGKKDVQWIEQELGDYLMQLKKRIPTVEEKDEENNISSLNVSMMSNVENVNGEYDENQQ